MKRAILVLVLATGTIAYIQFISMERWSRFWHVSLRSPVVIRQDFDFPELLDNIPATPDMNVIYFLGDKKYNDTNDWMADDLDPRDAIANDADEEDFGAFNENGGKKTPKRKLAVLDLKRFKLNDTDFSTKPLMVLFTSWEYSQEKEHVHETLRKTWSFWPSLFKPLVMTRDKLVQQQAKEAGWLFQTVTEVDKMCHGPPILSTMFKDVIKKHDAFFYGYSNSDIIFGDGLEKTMKYLYYYFSTWKTRPVLIVGRRYNIDFVKHSNTSLDSPKDVSAITKTGKLVIRSTDYFFSNRHFPWGMAPKVTIGKVWVVRAIIGWALKKGYAVIDATRTIEAVHLTTQDGVFASWHKDGAMCNERVLASLHWTIPTSIGHCECARLETFHAANGEIRIRHRPPSRLICSKQTKPSHSKQ